MNTTKMGHKRAGTLDIDQEISDNDLMRHVWFHRHCAAA